MRKRGKFNPDRQTLECGTAGPELPFRRTWPLGLLDRIAFTTAGNFKPMLILSGTASERR